MGKNMPTEGLDIEFYFTNGETREWMKQLISLSESVEKPERVHQVLHSKSTLLTMPPAISTAQLFWFLFERQMVFGVQ